MIKKLLFASVIAAPPIIYYTHSFHKDYTIEQIKLPSQSYVYTDSNNKAKDSQTFPVAIKDELAKIDKSTNAVAVVFKGATEFRRTIGRTFGPLGRDMVLETVESYPNLKVK